MNKKTYLLHVFRRAHVLERMTQRTVFTKDQHWLFQGLLMKKGHGRIGYNNKDFLIHRLAWEFFVGQIPKGIHVLHRCVGHPNCWNPLHLYLGTEAENAVDKMVQGRHVKSEGERNGNSKLTGVQVRNIRASCKNLTAREAARIAGVSMVTVHRIRQRKAWRGL